MFGDAAQGGSAPNRAIGRLGFATAQGADQPGEGLLQQGRGQADDFGIRKKVVQERAHVFDPFRTAEVQQQHADPGHALIFNARGRA